MTAAFNPYVEDDLAALNDLAHRELDGMTPEPVTCPRAGSWVQAYHVDDDARAIPEGSWHYVVGWAARWASLMLRCRNRNRRINYALLRPGWPRGASRNRLWVQTERPAAGACRACDRLLAMDAAGA